MASTPEVSRDKRVLRVILIEGCANLSVLVAKLAVGLSSGSLAVLGDAVHSLTDVANNVVAWLVVRVSSAPADREHPYGHRKFETLAVFGLAFLLMVLGFEIALKAVTKPQAPVTTGTWELLLMVGVLGVNTVLSYWQRYWARKLKSDILLADSGHTLADVLTTIAVIVGWQLSAMGYLWLDKLCALLVSAVVMYLAFGLFKRAIPVLVDGSAIEPELLIDAAKSIDGVRRVERVRSRWIGQDRAVDMIVCVDAQLPTDESHAIATQVEDVLEQRFAVTDVSIHIKPLS